VSDLIKHVLVGDMIGSFAANSENKFFHKTYTVFTLGVISHALMDMAEPDYTVNWFNQAQLGNASPFLALQGGGTFFVLKTMLHSTKKNHLARKLRIAAIIGAVIPDVIDGIYSLINPSAWYTGQLICPWHNANFNKMPWHINLMSMWATTLLSAGFIFLRYYSKPFIRFIFPRFSFSKIR
jgi:hypothetical protein